MSDACEHLLSLVGTVRERDADAFVVPLEVTLTDNVTVCCHTI